VTWSVDKVENIVLSVVSVIIKAHRTSFDSDTSFTLDIHIIEKLIFHISQLHSIGKLQNSIGKSRFAVVYMSYNAEISYIIFVHLLIFLSQTSILFHNTLL